MDRHEYMTTGEFAAAKGVSKDTLFHYDDIGLFLPGESIRKWLQTLFYLSAGNL